MENKQTAVEWLEEQIRNKIDIPIWIYKFLQQAKAMEKEQIKDAFTDGCIGELYELNAYYTSEKYYNKTYNVKDN
jgi:hypothetical protein